LKGSWLVFYDFFKVLAAGAAAGAAAGVAAASVEFTELTRVPFSNTLSSIFVYDK